MAATLRSAASIRTFVPVESKALKQTPARAFSKVALRQSVSLKASRVGTVSISAGKPGYEFDGKWYPGAKSPSYLDGTLPGDYGFDPLRLGANAQSLKYYQEAELMNGRYAMLAVAGIVFTDAAGLPKWWEAGSLEYPLDFTTLAGIQLVVMSAFEYKRFEGWKKTGGAGVLGSYPFDPMGMAKDNLEDMQLKEVKNARAAMLAFLGCVSQYLVTGMGPVDCLKAHLSDPTHNNIYTSSVGGEFTAAVVALSIAPMFIEAQKTLQESDDEPFRPIPW